MRYNLKPFDLVKHRNKFFAFSIGVTILGLITFLVFGLNYGVDFKAGTAVDVDLQKNATKAQVEEVILKSGLKAPEELRTGGTGNERLTIRFDEVLTNEQVSAFQNEMRAAFGEKTEFEINTVDPEIARELARSAIIGVIVASLGIMLYTIIRFEWRFALAAIIALFHDAFVVISFFSIFRLEVNLPFVAAVLTIIGYSINDTIVIFDRIRENLRFAKKKSYEHLAKLVNDSIWEVMTRSINTVVTVVFGAVALYAFGSDAIGLFSLAILVGLVCGTYSSICIASQIWLVLKKYSEDKKNQAQAQASSVGATK